MSCWAVHNNKPAFRFHADVAMVPHATKIKRGGEDAACVSPQILAVFDGVSAWWKEDDIDAGNYAYVHAALLQQQDEKTHCTAKELLALIFDQNT